MTTNYWTSTSFKYEVVDFYLMQYREDHKKQAIGAEAKEE